MTATPELLGREGGADGWYVLPVRGTLDRLSAARLVGLVGARLRMAELGQVRLRHVAVDLTSADGLTVDGLKGLTQAVELAARWRVGVHLIVPGAAAARLPLPVRCALGRYRVFPTVAAAQLAVDGAVRRA
ncbi:hypothetical protein ACQEVB_32615 [Pseudonocardia sp. CA-107938]|uniref:hypothetical protein n=1 Tax=Pseudonocardia sp. CA-107938 TaxID=3240021 RepID=UPI003D8C3DDD